MCMSRPKMPTPVAPSPPPMQVPESVDENVSRMKTRERARAASAYGRQSTILASAFGAQSAAPTSQAKTILGS